MRNRILIPTTGPEDWRPLLADRVKHWKVGYSACSLATAWEQADGFPSRVLSALETSAVDSLRGLSIIAAIPEYKTSLPGGATGSQTDLLVLARNDAGLVVLGIEGKAEEPFGPLCASGSSTDPPASAPA